MRVALLERRLHADDDRLLRRYRGGRSRRSAPCRTSARPSPRSGGSAACRDNSSAAPSVRHRVRQCRQAWACVLRHLASSRDRPKRGQRLAGSMVANPCYCNLTTGSNRCRQSRIYDWANRQQRPPEMVVRRRVRSARAHNDDFVGRHEVQGRPHTLIEQVGIDMPGRQSSTPSARVRHARRGAHRDWAFVGADLLVSRVQAMKPRSPSTRW